MLLGIIKMLLGIIKMFIEKSMFIFFNTNFMVSLFHYKLFNTNFMVSLFHNRIKI